MKSHVTQDFVKYYNNLPTHVKNQARKAYLIWKSNPNHPSLQFKTVGSKLPVYSVRIGIGWRAIGVKRHHSMIWFWIGSHADYDQLLKKM